MRSEGDFSHRAATTTTTIDQAFSWVSPICPGHLKNIISHFQNKKGDMFIWRFPQAGLEAQSGWANNASHKIKCSTQDSIQLCSKESFYSLYYRVISWKWFKKYIHIICMCDNRNVLSYNSCDTDHKKKTPSNQKRSERSHSNLRPFCSGIAHALVSFFLILISKGIGSEAKTLVS